MRFYHVVSGNEHDRTLPVQTPSLTALRHGLMPFQVSNRIMPAQQRREPGTTAGKEASRHSGRANRAAQAPLRAAGKRPPVGERIIEGLEQAIAWTRGENENVRVTLVHVPEVDVRKTRTTMGLSQAEFATRFGLPPAKLRNGEQGRSRPDAPTRVLLAVIAKHPEAIEDALRTAS